MLSHAQYPANPKTGNSSTLTEALGSYGGRIGYVFTASYGDTSAANLSFVKNVAGQQIRVGDTIWMRSNDLSRWLKQSSSGGGGGSITGGINGLSASGANILLGQDVNQSGNPAILISNREIPFGNNSLMFSAKGSTLDPPFGNGDSAQIITDFDESGTSRPNVWWKIPWSSRTIYQAQTRARPQARTFGSSNYRDSLGNTLFAAGFHYQDAGDDGTNYGTHYFLEMFNGEGTDPNSGAQYVAIEVDYATSAGNSHTNFVYDGSSQFGLAGTQRSIFGRAVIDDSIKAFVHIRTAVDTTAAIHLEGGTIVPPLINGNIYFDTGVDHLYMAIGGAWKQLDNETSPTIPISSLLAATGTNSINNAGFAQTWSWNSLTSGTGLTLNSTASSISESRLFEVLRSSNTSSGRHINIYSVNSNQTFSGQTPSHYAGFFSSRGTTVGGATKTNYGIYTNARSGDVNYAIYSDTGLVHLNDMTANSILGVNSTKDVVSVALSGASFDGTTLTVTGTPGGSNTQVQYNNSGAFGGISGATSNGTTLTITSGRATTDFSPTTDDGATLGTTSLKFSDLFLASNAVINFNSGNYTLTHTAGNLTANGNMILSSGNFVASTGSVAANNQLLSNSTGSNANFAVMSSTGGSSSTTAALLFGGAASIGIRTVLNGNAGYAMSANQNYSPFIVGRMGATEAASGVHAALAMSAVFTQSTVTGGSATTTDATSVYIEGRPLGANGFVTTNPTSALWVDAGLVRIDDTLAVNVVSPSDRFAINGNISLTTAGNKLKIATGSNASIGVSAAMTAGTITISTTAVTTNSRIFLTHATLGGTQGILSVGTITDGTSFVINSSSATDTGTVNWIIIN